jgi:hypothetical protein
MSQRAALPKTRRGRVRADYRAGLCAWSCEPAPERTATRTRWRSMPALRAYDRSPRGRWRPELEVFARLDTRRTP